MQRGRVEVLIGPSGGKYPDGNSVLVGGTHQRVLIDGAMHVAEAAEPPAVDQILLTHAHEDHTPALSRYPDTPVAVHERDLAALQSLDGLLALYGMPAAAAEAFIPDLVDHYHWRARPDAVGFTGAQQWDVGGSTITAIPTPGHTGGHTVFLVEPEGVLILGDLDLTGFGPYYGDAGSDLDEFVTSLATIRDIDAAWYVTYHHKGILSSRGDFLTALDAFASVIDRRDQAMLEFLAEPRTVDDMVARRFVYRAHVELPWLDSCERYTAERHLARFARDGRATEVEPGRWLASS